MKIFSNRFASFVKLASLLCILLASIDAKSQCGYLNDSTELDSGVYCTTPATVALRIHGTLSFNSSVDSMWVVVKWGYGDTVGLYVQLTPPNSSLKYYDTTLYHSYSISGVVSIQTSMTGWASVVCYKNLSTFVSYGCQTMSGRIYKDSNANCVLDSNESLIPYETLILIDSNENSVSAAVTDINGFYSAKIPNVNAGMKLKLPEYQGFNEVTCPDSTYYELDTISNFLDYFDYAKDCSSTNLIDHYTSVGAPRIGAPGETGIVKVRNFGYGCSLTGTNVSTTLTFDSLLHYVGIAFGPLPDSIVERTIYWTYPFTGGLNPFSALNATHLVRFTTDTSATLNDSVTCTSNVALATGDINPLNNIQEFRRPVNSSYDPNNIEVNRFGIGQQGYIENNQRLLYTINFQNTGTAPAKNVYLLDSISDKLDIGTFRFEASSHEVETKIYDGTLLRFNYFDIDLADSATNEPESKGWVTYSIEMKPDLPVGTQIKNRAHIYFDYNAAIITNTALNTIYEKPVVVIPPTALVINASGTDVSCKNNDNGSLSLNIISGEPPYTIAWSNGSMAYNQNQLSPGSYTVTVTDSAQQVETATIVIEENRIHEAPIVGAISGSNEVQSWETYNYTVATSGLSSYDWTAAGGEVVSSVANTAEVKWQAGPLGMLYVQETSEHGCFGVDSNEVSIQFVGIDEAIEHGFKIYPNPSEDNITIEIIDFIDSEKIEIYDVEGRLMLSQKLTDARTSISIEYLASGVYEVIVITKIGSQHQKLIIE